MSIPPRKVVNADVGDADHVGGNDWDAIADWLNNVDMTGPALMNTIMKWRSGKFIMRDSDNTHDYIVITSNLAANRNVTEPLLIANDERVYKLHIVTLSGKTLDSSCNVAAATGGGTPTNVNSEGVGPYKSKSGSNDQFYGTSAGSIGITTTLNPGTNATEIDVIEANLNKDYMQGGVFLRLLDELNIVSSSAEEEIFSCLIPAGKLETNRILRLTINGDYLGDSGTPRTFIIKFKYGATTLWGDTSVAVTNDSARRPVRMVFEMANRNDASSQVLGGVVFIGTAGNATTGLGDLAVDEIIATTPVSGVATEDSDTDDLFLKVTVQHAASESTTSYRRQMAVLEVL